MSETICDFAWPMRAEQPVVAWRLKPIGLMLGGAPWPIGTRGELHAAETIQRICG